MAFLKHTTVYENTDGKRKEWWARNALSEDFQLLCPDGKLAILSFFAGLFRVSFAILRCILFFRYSIDIR